jgi:membrane-bound lytic murein transglycosylase B
LLVVLLVAAAVSAGAYLVPRALDAAPARTAAAGFVPEGLGDPTAPVGLPAGPPSYPVAAYPSGLPTGAPTPPRVMAGQRPAAALAGWAQPIGTKVGIPVVALEAYGYAELVLARTTPGCHLSWTTLAAIGKVESNHGSHDHSVLGADGTVRPPIYGPPLNGQGGRQLIPDTDHGAIDGDPTYDRAVGPMQFIPSTWLAVKVDADNSGTADPNDIDDASLTAAVYLCQGGRDLSKPDQWYQAIMSYNAVQPYVRQIFTTANDYGVRSRS